MLAGTTIEARLVPENAYEPSEVTDVGNVTAVIDAQSLKKPSPTLVVSSLNVTDVSAVHPLKV